MCTSLIGLNTMPVGTRFKVDGVSWILVQRDKATKNAWVAFIRPAADRRPSTLFSIRVMRRCKNYQYVYDVIVTAPCGTVEATTTCQGDRGDWCSILVSDCMSALYAKMSDIADYYGTAAPLKFFAIADRIRHRIIQDLQLTQENKPPCPR